MLTEERAVRSEKQHGAVQGADVALDHTIDWHLAWRNGGDMTAVSLAQIEAYEAARVT